MLSITVEIHPGGFTPLRRTIATMRISNLSDLADCSDYRIEILEGPNPLTGSGPRSGECVIAAHDRRQSVWALIQKAAEEIQKSEFVDL